MGSFHKEVSYKRVVSSDSNGVDVCAIKAPPLCAALKRDALNTLINNELVREYASGHHITVTDAEFARQWAAIDKAKFHDQPRVVRAYAGRLGWTVADLKASIRQDLLQQKVMFAVTKNMSRYTPAVKVSRIDMPNQKEIKGVQDQLASGQSFQSIAAALNKDKKSLCHSEGGCGELGWLPTAFVPAGDKSVLQAKVGTVVGPFPGQQLYELLRVEGKNNHYPMTAQQQYRMRQQLFVQWLNRQVKKASITKHVTA
jgi:parvulin-like peptidyl-prolyl isomerase